MSFSVVTECHAPSPAELSVASGNQGCSRSSNGCLTQPAEPVRARLVSTGGMTEGFRVGAFATLTIVQIKVVIEPVGDGNRDGNRGERWRTLANVGGRTD
jgi:hypothetical protein